MSTLKKVAIAGLTIWPILYAAIFVAVWLASFFAMHSGLPEEMGVAFAVIFVVHAATMLVGFATLAFYGYHVFNNDLLEGNTQLLWFLIIFMAGPFGQIFYWYRYIWSDGAHGLDGSL